MELFGIGAKAKPEVDLTGLEGKLIDIFLARKERNVQVIVVTNDSPAKREGRDLLFAAWSESCAEALIARLELVSTSAQRTHNNSLDRSADRASFNLFFGFRVVHNRRARSTLTLAGS